MVGLKHIWRETKTITKYNVQMGQIPENPIKQFSSTFDRMDKNQNFFHGRILLRTLVGVPCPFIWWILAEHIIKLVWIEFDVQYFSTEELCGVQLNFIELKTNYMVFYWMHNLMLRKFVYFDREKSSRNIFFIYKWDKSHSSSLNVP